LYAAERISRRVERLIIELRSADAKVEECLRGGYVYKVADSYLVYEALIDFDSFFFEMKSAHEITLDFVSRVLCRILPKKPRSVNRKYAEQVIQEEFSRRNFDLRWLGDLSRMRNILIHNRSAAIVLEVSPELPRAFVPILVTADIREPHLDKYSFPIGECERVWFGFVGFYGHLESWLIEEIRKCGQPESEDCRLGRGD